MDIERRGSAPLALKRNISEQSDQSLENRARSNSLIGSGLSPFSRLPSMKESRRVSIDRSEEPKIKEEDNESEID